MEGRKSVRGTKRRNGFLNDAPLNNEFPPFEVFTTIPRGPLDCFLMNKSTHNGGSGGEQIRS